MTDVPIAIFHAADRARTAWLRKDPNDQIGALNAALSAVAPLIAAEEREACIQDVQIEPSPTGPMPDVLAAFDKTTIALASVEATKRSIEHRIRARAAIYRGEASR